MHPYIVLLRQSARWSIASEQDNNKMIALLHANYGFSYLLLIETLYNIGNPKYNEIKRNILEVERKAINRFGLDVSPDLFDCGVIGGLTGLSKGYYLIESLREKLKNERNILNRVIYANYMAGVLWALKDIYNDFHFVLNGINPLAFRDDIVEIQDRVSREFMRNRPDVFPKRSLLSDVAGM